MKTRSTVAGSAPAADCLDSVPCGEATDRVRAAAAMDIADAGRALSRLRERGVVLSNPPGR